MKEHQVPGYKIVEDKIREIDKEISIERAPYDSSRMAYKFHLIKDGRKCGVVFNDEFLDDLNDFTGSKTSEYWKKMESSLTSALLAPIEKQGLIPFAKEKLKELIFKHVKKTLQSTQHINKFNLLGRPYQEGSLERFIGVKFTNEERAAAGSAFDELKSQGILIPTYSDLINPEDWVKIGDIGKVGKIPIESIFLSSTVKDLRDCRAEVVNELQSKGIKVIYSESPEFAGILRDNVYDICLQNVLSSSHFVIILGRKYGEPYQGTRFKGISITHAELKVALEDKNKPILLYVRKHVWDYYAMWKDDPELKCDIDPEVFEMIKEFDETRQYITPFDTSVELKANILTRLGIS